MTFKEFMQENGYDLITTFWEDFSIADKYGIAGAEWRINSVWHDAKEVIIKSGYILVEFKTKRSVSYNIWKIERADVVSYWNVFMAENKIIRYAYRDDLLP